MKRRKAKKVLMLASVASISGSFRLSIRHMVFIFIRVRRFGTGWFIIRQKGCCRIGPMCWLR